MPIWKGDDASDPVDYRPISLTPHLSKIIERTVRIQMTTFLDENNLLEDSQHGSRGGRSTLTQLLKQYDLLVEKLARGQNVDVTFLDFSKAFDLVDHSLLLKKIKEKGFQGKLLS